MIRLRVLLAGLSLGLVTPWIAAGQEWPNYLVNPSSDPHDFLRGPGFYLAMYKLILITLVLLVWVKLAAWINKDASLYHERTRMTPEVWNPIIVFPFFAGFLWVISFPFFWIGFPLYFLAACVPPIVYLVGRNRKVAPEEKAFTAGSVKRRMSGRRAQDLGPISQEEGPPVTFKPAAKDARAVQATLIMLRQNPAYFTLKEILSDALARRVDQILLNYTKERVGIRFQLDGIWHDMPAMDRELGDALLYGLKQLAGLDPTNRKTRQSGSFGVQIPGRKLRAELTTQGVATGERALLKLVGERKSVVRLRECGMLESMEDRLRPHLNQSGLVLVSTMPGDGYTTTWNAVLESSDRILRDFHAFLPRDSRDTFVENIDAAYYDLSGDQDPLVPLKTLLLKQPEALVLPEADHPGVIDRLLEEVAKHQRFLITRIPARSSAEAILRFANLKINRERMTKLLTAVIYSRLVRRLCENCKEPYEPPPALLKKLGLEPGSVPALYREWQPPPPEELVDAKGRPIEPELCPVCGGLGYLGRIAIFEVVEVDEGMRKVLQTQPSVEALAKASRKAGNPTLQEEGLKLVLAGVTSLNELQRVLKASQGS